MTDVNTIASGYIDLWNERTPSAAAKCWRRTGQPTPTTSIR